MTRFAALLLSACTSVLPCETCPQEPARIAVDVCVDDAFDEGECWTAAMEPVACPEKTP